MGGAKRGSVRVWSSVKQLLIWRGFSRLKQRGLEWEAQPVKTGAEISDISDPARGIELWPSLGDPFDADCTMTSSWEDIHHSQASKSRSTSPRICVGCKGQILDQYILRVAPNKEWHGSCLNCFECKLSLDETCTCFVRDQKIYCKTDYVRLFSARCAKCQELFSPDDFVMRAKNKIFHLKCFQCLSCGKQLIQGDEFALQSEKVLCKHCTDCDSRPVGNLGEDYPEERNNNNNSHILEEMMATKMRPDSSVKGDFKPPQGETGTEDFDDYDDEDSSDMKFNGYDMSRSSLEAQKLEAPDSPSGHSSSDGNGRSQETQQVRRSRAGRVRTVLTEKQLNMLKSCYQVNKRPDALVKEQLVEMTGLSPRVVRVWFQNKRCKDKKKLSLLQEKESQKHGYGSMQGVPMIASNPVMSEPGLIPSMANHMADIRHYEAPWKLLQDMASGSDPDKNQSHLQFQHITRQMHGFDMGRAQFPSPFPEGQESGPLLPDHYGLIPFPGFMPEDPMGGTSHMSNHSVESTNYTITSLDLATSPLGSEG